MSAEYWNNVSSGFWGEDLADVTSGIPIGYNQGRPLGHSKSNVLRCLQIIREEGPMATWTKLLVRLRKEGAFVSETNFCLLRREVFPDAPNLNRLCGRERKMIRGR